LIKASTLSLITIGIEGKDLWVFSKTLTFFLAGLSACFSGDTDGEAGLSFWETFFSGIEDIVFSGVGIVFSSLEMVLWGKEGNGDLEVAHPAIRKQNIKKLRIFFILTEALFYFIRGFNTLKDFF